MDDRRLEVAAHRMRLMGVLGAMAALTGMGMPQILDNVLSEQAVLDREEQRRKTDAARRIAPLNLPSGTRECETCQKTISANKRWCFACYEVRQVKAAFESSDKAQALAVVAVKATGHAGSCMRWDDSMNPCDCGFEEPIKTPTYSCGEAYCDDPVCTTHGGLGGDPEPFKFPQDMDA